MQQKLQQKRIEAKDLKPKLVLKQKPFKDMALMLQLKDFKHIMEQKLQQKCIEAKVYVFDSNLKWTLKQH